MTRRESRHFRAPLSGQGLGFAARKLGLEVSRSNRNASRYFNGGQVSDRARQEIISSLALDLVEQGVFPELRMPNYDGREFADLLGKAITVCAGEWDALVGKLRGESAPVDRPDLAGAAYLRLVAIDVSVRYAAVLCLAGLSAPPQGIPLWADQRGGCLYLRGLLERCGKTAPTRADLAGLLAVSTNTVDSWLDSNVRPRGYHLEEIGKALAPLIDGMDARSATGGLRFHYGLSEMCAELELHIGREAVVETAEAIVRFAARCHAELSTFGDPSVDILAALVLLAAFTGGARMGFGQLFLPIVAEQEDDNLWELELVSATLPWHRRIQFVMKALSETGSAAARAKEQYGIPEEFAESVMDDTLRWLQAGPAIRRPFPPDAHVYRIKGDARYSAGNRLLQYEQAMALGDIETALVHIRRAVELQPEDSKYHFLLADALAKSGDVENGMRECWIADSLNPADELPRVEVGIILMNADRNPEACDHLERMARDRDDLSAHLSFNLGVARFRCGDYEGAQHALDWSLSLRGDYGPALDAAALSAFELGDNRRGQRFAKKARRHGSTEAFEKWRAGHYRKSRR